MSAADIIGGFFVGTGWGVYVGISYMRHIHRNDLPQWKAVLGDFMSQQFEGIRTMEKFSGMTATQHCLVGDDDETFYVTVTHVQDEEEDA